MLPRDKHRPAVAAASPLEPRVRVPLPADFVRVLHRPNRRQMLGVGLAAGTAGLAFNVDDWQLLRLRAGRTSALLLVRA